MHIRRMEPKDLDEVLLICKESFGKDAWNRKAFEREFELEYSHKFVIEDQGQILGYAIVWIMYKEATLMSIAIKKDLWGMGLGKRLMEFLIEYLKDKVESFFLDVRKSNIRAIRLYQSLGFKIFSLRNEYYSDGEDAFQMVLKLEEKYGNKGKTLEVVDTRGEAFRES